MKKSITIIGIIIIVAGVIGWFVFSGLSPHQHSNTVSSQEAGSTQLGKAPDFHLQDYHGKTVNLTDFAGKPLVINSWASWCPFCKQELPDFATAQKEFGDKVVIIAIDRAESSGAAKAYTDQQGTTDSLIFLLDPSDSFYQSIGGFSMPETIFIDKNGNIVGHKRGPMDINEIRQKINQLIAFN